MTLYIYVPNKEVQTSEDNWVEFCEDCFDGVHIFDTTIKGTEYQFGIVISGNWSPITWEGLSNEFKTQLLLLGVL